MALQSKQDRVPRLPYQTFQFDQRLQDGYFSAAYFLKTQQIFTAHYPKDQHPTIVMQFFQRHHALLCGIDEVIALIHQYAHHPDTLEISALNDGDLIEPFETVLTIKGHYVNFGFLEGIIDGILARRTSIATNAQLLSRIASPHPIIFMGDREDHYLHQSGDGYACKIGGINHFATNAMGEWIGEQGMGTMPHALIQGFQGDIIAACAAYHAQFPDEPLIALVDYHNDVITDSLKVARHFKQTLSAVRVDTSPNMRDRYFDTVNEPSSTEQYGVNPTLIKVLRKALDNEGFQQVKIIASGNFNAEKLQDFIDNAAPVNFYGIGSALLKIKIGFTGDCVLLNDQDCAKAGRKSRPNPKLINVPYPLSQ